MDTFEENVNTRPKLVLDTPRHCYFCSSEISSFSDRTVVQINPLCTLLKINVVDVVEAALGKKAPTMPVPTLLAGLCPVCVENYKGLQKAELDIKESKRKFQDQLEVMTGKLTRELGESCQEQIYLSASAMCTERCTLAFRKGIRNQATLALEQMNMECGMEAIPGLVSYPPTENSSRSLGEQSETSDIEAISVVDNNSRPSSSNFANDAHESGASRNQVNLQEEDLQDLQRNNNNSSEDQAALPSASISAACVIQHANPKIIVKTSRAGPASKTGRKPYQTGPTNMNDESADSFVQNLLQAAHNPNERCIVNNTMNVAGPSRQIDTLLPNSLINRLQQSRPRDLEGIQINQVEQSRQLLSKTGNKTAKGKEHLLYTKEGGMIHCKMCDQVFACVSQHSIHFKKSHDTSCKFCKKEFAYPKSYARHMQICKQKL